MFYLLTYFKMRRNEFGARAPSPVAGLKAEGRGIGGEEGEERGQKERERIPLMSEVR